MQTASYVALGLDNNHLVLYYEMYKPKINVWFDITLHWFIVCVQHKQCWDDNEREKEIIEIKFYVFKTVDVITIPFASGPTQIR